MHRASHCFFSCPSPCPRCVVQRVDVDTGRVVVTLSQTTVSASPGLYLRSFLSEAFASSNSQGPRSGEGDGEGDASPWGRLEFGATSNAVVVALKEYGLVLKAAATKKDKGGQLMVCKPEHAMEGVEEGNEVKVRREQLYFARGGGGGLKFPPGWGVFFFFFRGGVEKKKWISLCSDTIFGSDYCVVP